MPGGVFRVILVLMSTMGLVETLGALGAVEFMALARDTHQRHSQKEQGEKFHRAAS